MSEEKDTIEDQPHRAILNEPVWLETILNHLPPGGASENWKRDGISSLLWLIVHGRAPKPPWKEFQTVPAIGEWFKRQGLMGTEDLSWIYGARVIVSTMGAREAFKRLGDEEHYEFLRRVTRSMAGCITYGTGRFRGKRPDYAKLAAELAINRAHVIRGTEPPSPLTGGAPSLVCVGDRSFAHNGLGWIGAGSLAALPVLIRGDLDRYCACQTAVRSVLALRAVGADPRLITPAESEIAKAAILNDEEALLEIWHNWLGQAPLPDDEFLMIRRENGEEWGRIGGTTAPTAHLDLGQSRDPEDPKGTSDTLWLAANDGFRTGRDPDDGDRSFIEPTVLEHDPELTRWWAYDPDNPKQRVEAPALDGKIVFAARFGRDKRELIYPNRVSVPVPAPQPTPEPTPAPVPAVEMLRTRDFFLPPAPVWAIPTDPALASIRGHWFGTFATGRADLVVLCKGGPPAPHAFECYAVDADGIWLLSESTPGDGKYRSLWSDGEIGQPWLPLEVPAKGGEESAGTIDCRFDIVQHGWDGEGERQFLGGHSITRVWYDPELDQLVREERHAPEAPEDERWTETYIYRRGLGLVYWKSVGAHQGDGPVRGRALPALSVDALRPFKVTPGPLRAHGVDPDGKVGQRWILGTGAPLPPLTDERRPVRAAEPPPPLPPPVRRKGGGCASVIFWAALAGAGVAAAIAAVL